ncbi:MAG: EscU/YscU/HrcU family type III secretion system export apparatus switch protein [Rickettsiaceae bacterium]|nr:EscU/YscU/HrcU family type III secretion system export apparatus switch protein [Rickettsiaceae bacterium]
MNYIKDTNQLNQNKQAIALGYNKYQDIAPKILANGRGRIAEKIIEIAEELDIPIKENKELVKILSVLEIDSIIPLEAYSAVAEIISAVYKYKKHE